MADTYLSNGRHHPKITYEEVAKTNAYDRGSILTSIQDLLSKYPDRASDSLISWWNAETNNGQDAQAKINYYASHPSEPVQTYVNPGNAAKQSQAEAEYQARLSGDAVYNQQTGLTTYTDQGARTLGTTAGATFASNSGQGTNGVPTAVLEGAMSNLAQQGLMINPNKELTAADVAEFLKRAEQEVAPYYASALKLGRQAYLQASGYNKQALLDNEAELERKYGKDFNTLNENSADTGFAQSGKRNLDEQELAKSYNTTLMTGRRKLENDENTRAMQFAEKYGSSNLPQGQTIAQGPRFDAGSKSVVPGERNIPLYNLSSDILDGIIGSNQKEQATGTRELGQFYENQARTARTISL